MSTISINSVPFKDVGLENSHVNHFHQLSIFKGRKNNSVGLKGPHVSNKYMQQLMYDNNKLMVVFLKFFKKIHYFLLD